MFYWVANNSKFSANQWKFDKTDPHCSVARSKSNPCKKATGILAGSWRDPTGIPAGSCRDFGRRDFRSPAGSHRDSRRVLPRFWPPGFPFPAVNPGGILAGLPPGSRRDFGRRDFASRRERWRDRPPRLWPLSFHSPP